MNPKIQINRLSTPFKLLTSALWKTKLFVAISTAFLFLTAHVVQAQTVRTVGAGGNYATLRAAFDAINNRTITGAIELQITSSITDNNAAKLYGAGQLGELTIPAGQGGSGYVVGEILTFSAPQAAGGIAATARVSSVSSGAIASLEITNYGSGYSSAPNIASTSGSGSGANPTVIIGGDYSSLDIYPTIANVVLSGAVFGLNAVVDLVGADNVTIDGRVNRAGTTTGMTIQNSQVGFTGAFTFRARNEANSNTIRYARLLSDVSARVELTSSTNGKGVSDFLIENSRISVITGSTIATSQTGIAISGSASNKKITILNNEFVDLLAKETNMIQLNNSPDSVNIEANHFFQTTNLTLGDFSKIGIRVNSGTNVTIRGNYIGGSARQLGGTAFKYTSTGATIASFWGVLVGATPTVVIENNSIGNLDLTIQSGVVHGIESSSLNTIIRNNSIGDINSTNSIITNVAFIGIQRPGTGSFSIEQNTIGGIESGSYMSAIRITGAAVGDILNNTIGNMTLKSNAILQFDEFMGVRVGNGNYYNINGNYIYGFINQQPTTAIGIFFFGAGTATNNIVHLQPSSTGPTRGISTSGSGAVNLYYNTVVIDGPVNAGNKNSYALFDNRSGSRDYRNNLFINTAANTGVASGKHHAISLTSVPTTINYNNYYVNGTGGVLGSFNNVDKTSLADWRASTQQDCFSTSVNPNFPTSTGVATSNFLPANQNLVATPLFDIIVDYSGINRNAANPAMGALEFTVTPPSSNTTTTAAACGSYTWSINSQTYTQSGAYSSVNGCNTEILVLTITPSISNTTTASACDSYTWSVDGNTYTQSGTFSSVSGCTTEILLLTITPSISNTTTTSACDSYTWSVDGQTYTSSGIYSSVIGCATEILVLTITPSIDSTATVSVCGSYTWTINGQTYTASGTYSSISGCITEILILTLTPPSTWYSDADNDGYSNGTMQTACTRPTGFKLSGELTAIAGDCNDNDFSIKPGVAEVCGDAVDNNCNGQIDEGCQVSCGFNTLSQGGWATKNNPLTASFFTNKFPSGLYIGVSGRSILLTTAAAVKSFLPNSGTAVRLTQNWINPTNRTLKNTLAGQLVALRLNMAYNPGLATAIVSSTDIYNGWTVQQLFNEANSKISSSTAISSSVLSSLSSACEKVNLSYHQGSVSGYVICSTSPVRLFSETDYVGAITFQLFPNPSSSYVNLIIESLNTDNFTQVSVFNLTGQLVEQVLNIPSGEVIMLGHALSPGVYLVNIQNGTERRTVRFVKH